MGIGVDIPWAPIQLDANMGWCSAINEMLLFSVPGRISILPALPRKWNKGKVEGLLARGGIEVSLEWNMNERTVKVSLLSRKTDCTLDIILPDMVEKVDSYEISNGKVRNISLKAGEILTMLMKTI